MPDFTEKDVKDLMETLKEVLGEDTDMDIVDSIIRLLALPDEQFSVLAPGVLQSFQQSLNNPNDKITLVQSLNASGAKAEDLITIYADLMEEVDKTSLPRVKRDFMKEVLSAVCNAINDTEGIAKRNVAVAIELCHEDAKIPQYAHISDSGADVYALEDIVVHPGETVLVPTGFKVALPPGFELQVRAKSGRALKTKLRLANAIGTIDQEYRDEVKVIIENVEAPIKDITVDEEGRVTSILYGSDFTIGKGEKFCQIVLCEVPKASFYRVESVLKVDENDRGGGFGSTSLK